MIRIGMWKNEKDDKTWISGMLFGLRVTLWENEKREQGSNQPHYHLTIDTFKKKEEQQSQEPF